MIIPAIDLIDGNVVRLYQGRYDSTTQYDFSPLGLRNQYAQAGADWLHIVDLSGAKDATKRQLKLLTELRTAAPLHIQVGGGVRSEQDLIDLLDAGAGRTRRCGKRPGGGRAAGRGADAARSLFPRNALLAAPRG